MTFSGKTTLLAGKRLVISTGEPARPRTATMSDLDEADTTRVSSRELSSVNSLSQEISITGSFVLSDSRAQDSTADAATAAAQRVFRNPYFMF